MSKLTPEDIVLRYSKRGMNILKKYLKDGYCRTAAEKLLHAERGTVLLTTGFYVAGYAETDGPLGTVAVAEALNQLGFHSVVVTDKYCKGFFELKQLDVEYVDIAADEQVYEDILDKYNPVYMISIERCGENAEHEYANMRGVSITSETAAIDHLFELAPEKHIPTIGVGDGGNEIGMGNMFADYFKQIARYNSERKGWYVYDGSVWRPDKGNLKVSELAKLLADKLYVFALTITEEDARKRFIDRVRKLQLRKNRETMLRDAMSVYPISMQAFDRNKYFFNCKNGTLDMRTLEFREHRPEDYLTMESGITYDPDADCPRWHSFIKEVMCGDADLADFLQRSLGYALTGDTSQECMFILYGATSRNGKGTAMETFLKIMGDYGKTSNPDMLAAKFRGGNTGGPSEEVARLVGSRFVNISEPEKKITFNAALVKRMTGNDTINARFLNENSFDFVPVFKIFINTNYLPNVNDMTLFQSGRLKIIPFNRHFEEGEQDQGLKGQFAKPENLSGIFNWCLEGYKKFCQRGLELPQAVTKATEDYKDDSDRIGQFIEAWLEKEDGSELRTAAAYQLYTKWCEENGYSSENQKNFKNAIGVHFKVVRKRPKGGGGQTTLIMDCKFKEVEAGAEDLTVQDAYKPKDSLL